MSDALVGGAVAITQWQSGTSRGSFPAGPGRGRGPTKSSRTSGLGTSGGFTINRSRMFLLYMPKRFQPKAAKVLIDFLIDKMGLPRTIRNTL